MNGREIFARENNFVRNNNNQEPHMLKHKITQAAITCSKLTIETLEQGVKYVQS